MTCSGSVSVACVTHLPLLDNLVINSRCCFSLCIFVHSIRQVRTSQLVCLTCIDIQCCSAVVHNAALASTQMFPCLRGKYGRRFMSVQLEPGMYLLDGIGQLEVSACDQYMITSHDLLSQERLTLAPKSGALGVGLYRPSNLIHNIGRYLQYTRCKQLQLMTMCRHEVASHLLGEDLAQTISG